MMIRRVACRLQGYPASELIRQCGVLSHAAQWHNSATLSSKKPREIKKVQSTSTAKSKNDDERSTVDPALQQERSTVDPALQQAAETVAHSIPKGGRKVKADLLEQLQSFARLSYAQSPGEGKDTAAAAAKLSTLLTGMSVQKYRRAVDYDDAPGGLGKASEGQRKPFVRRRQGYSDSSREKVKLFEGPGLGIFTAADKLQAETLEVTTGESLWGKVRREQLAALSSPPPTNAFEEMVKWTKEGKLWHYPIDNEQGMDEEAKVGFHEHVFLEEQIKDFPRRGPIRHFMELVLVGLSKNPYLTVQQKHEHIDWFRQYFKEKKEVLEEALGPDGLMSEPCDKKSEQLAKSEAN